MPNAKWGHLPSFSLHNKLSNQETDISVGHPKCSQTRNYLFISLVSSHNLIFQCNLLLKCHLQPMVVSKGNTGNNNPDCHDISWMVA